MVLLCAVFVASLFLPLAVSTSLKLERAFPVETNLSELVRKDKVRHERIINFDLRGSPRLDYFGFYFTKVLIGSPAKEYNLIVDTGSDITWVSCKPCDGCPTHNKFGIQLHPYDPSNSSSKSLISCSDQRCPNPRCTRSNRLCHYEIKYLDKSFSKGFLVEDAFHFDTIMNGSAAAYTSKSLIFGCSNYCSGRFATSDTSVDEILGVSYADISIFSQLSSSGIVPQVISHCLSGNNGGGLLILGEILEPGIVFTPLVPSRISSYNVNLQSIAIKGKAIQVDEAVFAAEEGTVVDSGTTLVFIAEKAYDIFINDLIAAVSQSARPVVFESFQCFEVSDGVHDIFPPISFHFEGGVSIILKPRDYLFWNFLDGVEAWCTSFHKGRGVTILGEILLKDKIVIYDVSRQRVGWVDYNCSQPVNVSTTYESYRRPQRASSSKLDARLILILVTSALTLHIILFL